MNNAVDLYLYHRTGSYIPRVAAVHDLCGYGKCSLGVAIPVLSAAGCDVCPVPTSLFSAHTRFPTFYMHDTTDMLTGYLDAWVEENIVLDAIYSGFLGAPEQVGAIQRLYPEELCQAMAALVDGADLLTPNLTEASILTGIPYQGQDVDEDFVRKNLDALVEMGAKVVVIKGIVHEGEDIIRNYVAGANVAFEEVSGELLPYMLHGTGDLYCSGLLAAVMAGRSLHDAVEFAGSFVRDSMAITCEQPDFAIRGVSFESQLGKVAALLG